MVEVHCLHRAPEPLARHLPYPVRPVGREHRRLRPEVSAPHRLVVERLPEVGPVGELHDVRHRGRDALHLAAGVRLLQEHRAAHSASASATPDTSLWTLRPVTQTPDAAVTISPAAS